jgi:two-component system chemotaxis sensor kinase CheA
VRRIEKLPVASVRRGADGAGQIVIDGRIVPLLGLAGELPETDLAMFRVGEGEDEVAFAYERMIDLVEFDPLAVTDGRGGAGERLALVEGRPVELLDARALRAAPVTEGA